MANLIQFQMRVKGSKQACQIVYETQNFAECFEAKEKSGLNHKFCGIQDSARNYDGSYRIVSERNIRHQDIRIPVCEES